MRCDGGRTGLRGCAAGLLLALFALPAVGGAEAPPRAPRPAGGDQCFLIRQFDSWKGADEQTIYIRANGNDYFRLDLSAACPGATDPYARLITHTVGGPTVCTALDLDLRIATGAGPLSFPTPCYVKTMTKLTPAEVLALPRTVKPD